MNFDLSEEQQVISELSRQIFEGRAGTERVKAVEAAGGFDRDLWHELAKANLLGLALPESVGGSGQGFVEAVLVLIEQGRRVAPVPLWPTVVGSLTIAEFGSDDLKRTLLPAVSSGNAVLSVALNEGGINDALKPTVRAERTAGGLRLQGRKPSVPYGPIADHILVTATDENGHLFAAVVSTTADGVTREDVRTTSREPQAHFALDTTVPETAVLSGVSGDGRRVVEFALQRALVALSAVQVGVCESALSQTAEYVTNRLQFGRPLSTFQAVGQRAASAYVDVEAMRVTLLNAAWRLGEGLSADEEVLVAKFWASEGGQRVVHACQHLHGGMGADVDYPIHRYFLWGVQLDTTLGGASAQLAQLGRLIASR